MNTNSPLENILAHFPDAKKNGRGFNVCCPGHDDHKPSLNIDEGEDGRVLLICRAGCSTDQIVSAMGIKTSDLFPEPNGRSKSKKPPKRKNPRQPELHGEGYDPYPLMKDGYKRTAVYDYTDRTGETVLQAVRFEHPTEPKTFRQRRPIGGKWCWFLDNIEGHADCSRVLYQLPVLAEVDDDEWIFVVEGEKDVHSLERFGLIATCNPMGSGKWKHVDESPLHSRNVAIFADNDTPGQKHAEEVATSLHGKAKDVRIVSLPDLPEKGDVTDWIESQRDVEDDSIAMGLMGITLSSRVFRPTANNGGPRESEIIYKLASEIEEKPVDWLWDQRIVAGAINLLMGYPSEGKSLFSCDLAARISKGQDWPLGEKRQNRVGTVCMMNIEDNAGRTIVPRLRVAGANMEKIIIPDFVRRGEERDSFDISRDVRLLEDLHEQHPDLRLVVIDPLDSYLPGVDTKVGNEVRGAMWPLKDWAEKSGVTVIIIHHYNKSGSTNALDRVSGARSFAALPRAVWAIARDKTAIGNRSIIAPAKLNLARSPKAMAYQIKSSMFDSEIPCIHWEADELDISADDMLQPPKSTSTDDAADFLEEVLSDGAVASKDLEKAAGENGYSMTGAIARAKKKIGAGSKKIGGIWYVGKPEQIGNLIKGEAEADNAD